MTWTGDELLPAPMAEYGVHEYVPLSSAITVRMTRVPRLVCLTRSTLAKLTTRPPLVHTMCVIPGFASIGQSILPIMPRGRYRCVGMLRTRGRSTRRQNRDVATLHTECIDGNIVIVSYNRGESTAYDHIRLSQRATTPFTRLSESFSRAW